MVPRRPYTGWMALAMACLWVLCLSWPSATVAALSWPGGDILHQDNMPFDRELLELSEDALVEEMRWLLDEVHTLRRGRRHRDLLVLPGLSDVASCAKGIADLVETRGNPYVKV